MWGIPLKIRLLTLNIQQSETSQYVIDAYKSLTYYACMIFVESPVFTRQVAELLNDEEYSDLQQFLVSQPDAGDVIQGTGGLGKVRWVTAGKGKRGGSRVIYFHASKQRQIRMPLIYRKGFKDDLSAAEKESTSKFERELVGELTHG